jgi:hypothetical protein
MAATFSASELKQIYDFALDLGRRAGRILIEGVEKRTGDVGAREEGGGGEQKEKMNAVDIVTQTDLGTYVRLLVSYFWGRFRCKVGREADHVMMGCRC